MGENSIQPDSIQPLTKGDTLAVDYFYSYSNGTTAMVGTSSPLKTEVSKSVHKCPVTRTRLDPDFLGVFLATSMPI